MKEVIDILNRQKFIDRLISLINQISENKNGCTFAIDGEWGCGKSFVLDIFQKQIEETDINKYLIFQYNCWKYDYYDEPSIAIVSAMLDKAYEKNSLMSAKVGGAVQDIWVEAKNTLEEVAGEFIKNKIGVNLVEIVKDINKNGRKRIARKETFDSQFSFKKTLEITRKQLQRLAKKKTIIVIVDELDRCLPEYSMKVLERLHHLFDEIGSIIVIIAIDSKQLENSVKQIYGKETDVEKYLRKFISFTVSLDKGKVTESFFEKYNAYISLFNNVAHENTEVMNELITYIFSDIDIRTQEKLIEKAETIHKLVCNEKLDISVMCYELMWTTFSYRCKTTNLDWVARINNTSFPYIEEYIGKELLRYLKELESKVGSGIVTMLGQNGGKYKKLSNNFTDRIFWYFSSIYYEIQNSITSGSYHNENAYMINNEVETARKFNDMAKLIK